MRAGITRARIISARYRAFRSGLPLPPGGFFRLLPYWKSDRRALVDKAELLGPIMTAAWDGHVTICVIGLPTARRLLSEHSGQMRPMSIVLDSVVPNGFLRMMEGDNHRRYRPVFVRAFDTAILSHAEADVREMMSSGLDGYLGAIGNTARQVQILADIATCALIRVCLGIRQVDPLFAELQKHFHRMGPNDFAWSIGQNQRHAFSALRERLEKLVDFTETADEPFDERSALGRIIEAGFPDATTIGNLIYMIEMGRHDLRKYFEWIIRFVDQDPSFHSGFSQEMPAEDGEISCARSIAYETLRMERSERLTRMVLRDFQFDGFLFPKGSIVMINLWEAHKNRHNFQDPYTFDPDRFVNNKFSASQYAPFGLGHHRCPASDLVIRLAELFVETLGRLRF